MQMRGWDGKQDIHFIGVKTRPDLSLIVSLSPTLLSPVNKKWWIVSWSYSYTSVIVSANIIFQTFKIFTQTSLKFLVMIKISNLWPVFLQLTVYRANQNQFYFYLNLSLCGTLSNWDRIKKIQADILGESSHVIITITVEYAPLIFSVKGRH